MGGNVLSITYPKSGSHMVGFALGLGTRPTWHRSSGRNYEKFTTEDEYLRMVANYVHKRGLWTHIPYSDRAREVVNENYKAVLYTRRDPRDVVVSIAHYVPKNNGRLNLNYIRDGKHLHEHDWDNRIAYIIDTVANEMSKFIGWTQCEEIFQVRYEDMIDDRHAVLQKIDEFLQSRNAGRVNIPEAIDRSHKRHPLSFRRGKYGDWKFDFHPKNTLYAMEKLTPLMEALGYEWSAEMPVVQQYAEEHV